MNKDCWDEIRNLKGRTLKTLDRRKPFQVIEVTDQTVIILPLETGKERPIPRAGLENAFRRLSVIGRVTRSEIMADFSPVNPAYVVAMLAEMPGVKYFLNPIRLKMGGY